MTEPNNIAESLGEFAPVTPLVVLKDALILVRDMGHDPVKAVEDLDDAINAEMPHFKLLEDFQLQARHKIVESLVNKLLNS